MATQILRPPHRGVPKQQTSWLLKGTWRKRAVAPMTTNALHNLLHRELVESGLMKPDSVGPSNKYHSNVTDLIRESSWRDGRWVLDGP